MVNNFFGNHVATLPLPFLIHANILEPVRPAIFFEKESFAVGEPTRDTTFTLGRLRAVEVGYVLIAYITKPEM